MLLTLPFNGTVKADAVQTLVTGRIELGFIVREFTVYDVLNTQRTCEVKVFVGNTNEAPTTGEPEGENVLLYQVQSDYIVYDDTPKTVHCYKYVAPGGKFVKVYYKNNDISYDHTIDCEVVIDAFLKEQKPTDWED